MRRVFTIYLLLFVCAILPLTAQKKEINSARDLLKQGKDANKVEQSMTKLLADSANKKNEKIWNLLFESLQKQYRDGNEKLYLKQKYDTASLFNIASRMFTAMETYDSIEALPDKKGRVELKKRKQNASILNTLRPNLYNGGLYFIKKKDYKQAYQLLDQYISTADKPMFQTYNYGTTDKNLPEAAYWAVYAAYKQKDAKKVLHHTYLALKDVDNHESMLQYLSETYILEGDTARWINTLEEGFEQYPTSDYFFPHLIEYYSNKQDWEKALETADYALKADSLNKMALLAKSTLLLNTGDYSQSFSIAENLVKRDSTLTEAWLNAGLALFNKGVTLDKNVQSLKTKRNETLKYYQEALPYLERYRQIMPEAKDKWALPLYTIYLNLNMGKKFDEIDKILKNNR